MDEASEWIVGPAATLPTPAWVRRAEDEYRQASALVEERPGERFAEEWLATAAEDYRAAQRWRLAARVSVDTAAAVA